MTTTAAGKAVLVGAWAREWPLVIAALIFLAAYAVPILNRDLASWLLDSCRLLSWITWGIFVVDFPVRLFLADQRLRPTWSGTGTTSPTLPLLRPLRLLRLIPLPSVQLKESDQPLARGMAAVVVWDGVTGPSRPPAASCHGVLRDSPRYKPHQHAPLWQTKPAEAPSDRRHAETTVLKWTLERELTEMAGIKPVQNAIYTLGLLPQHERLAGFVTENWAAGGAETYLYPFILRAESGWNRRYLLKAVVVFGSDVAVGRTAERWQLRRLFLDKAGIRVPKCYALYKATFLEEWIPDALEDELRYPERAPRCLESLTRYVGVLDAVDPFRDLRVKAGQVVPVDFGSDLGPPGAAANRNERHWHALVKASADWHVELQHLRQVYSHASIPAKELSHDQLG
jgi:hypothetical protein